MIKFGVIGTGSIVSEFVTVCNGLKEAEVCCIYSRQQATGDDFAKKHQVDKV